MDEPIRQPADWTADRPPTRAEALLAAARALSLPGGWLPPAALHAQAHYAEAWTAVAALAERDGGMPDAELSRLTLIPPADPPVWTGTCDRQITAVKIGHNGGWLHLPSLGRCAEPPGYAQRVPGE